MGGCPPGRRGRLPSYSITCAPLITLSTCPGPSASSSPCLLLAGSQPWLQFCTSLSPWLSCTPLPARPSPLPNTLRSFFSQAPWSLLACSRHPFFLGAGVAPFISLITLDPCCRHTWDFPSSPSRRPKHTPVAPGHPFFLLCPCTL